MLAIALFALGVFAAIYHPVGMPMLIERQAINAATRCRFNGVCGNLGVSLAAGITAALTTWIGWRCGVSGIPAVVFVATGIVYSGADADDDRHHANTPQSQPT